MHHALPRLTSHHVRLFACLVLLATLGACGGSHTHRTAHHYSPSRYYAPPGPNSDPWGPYIHEASGRFGVPENWIRGVMHQESGGQEDVISWAGAMGLMQVMPDTYDDLRGRYNLGDDPFDPHNNILAGTAYLREMYDRYGAPGFLAAYNAGPNRVDRYLANGTPLPAETVNYVASIAPLLSTNTPMSGPLAVYAGGATVTRVAYHPTPAGCDPDAAYDPGRPCTPFRQAASQTAAIGPVPYAASAPYGADGCSPDAAYDPTRPCTPRRSPAVQAPAIASVPIAPAPSGAEGCDPDAAYDPTQPCRLPPRAPVVVEPIAPPARLAAQAVAPSAASPPGNRPPTRYLAEARPIQERMAQPVAFAAQAPPGRWTIQVGAFATLSTAEAAAETARATEPNLLRTTRIELPATAPFGKQVAFRARLSGLSGSAAAEACGRLSSQGIPCITVPPSRDSF